MDMMPLFSVCIVCFVSLRLCEGGEDAPEDEKVVSTLRSALWEKERKLTDIRLEALSSAHQLEQLQEAMNNMQVCVSACVYVCFCVT